MKIYIDELPVYFPFDKIYKEQYEYMKQIKKCLDQKGHGILEMPTGTGKTVSLLSIFSSYIEFYPDRFKKLVYCTRTVAEMNKTLQELSFINKKRREDQSIMGDKNWNILAVGLSAKRNLCVHPNVRQYKEREKTDAECKKLTANWIRDKHINKPGEQDYLCQYYENVQSQKQQPFIQELKGVYSLDDLKQFGINNTICPYYLSKMVMDKADIVVYNYLYMLDPTLSQQIKNSQKEQTIVVFDEAHNIDDICVESYSVRLNKGILQMATQNVVNLQSEVNNISKNDQEQLIAEYQKLLEGLTNKKMITQQQKVQLENTNEGKQLIQQAIPGNIRKADKFLKCVQRLLHYCKEQLSCKNFRSYSIDVFMDELHKKTTIDKRTLSFFQDRYIHLLNHLKIVQTDEFSSLQKLLQFSQLISNQESCQFALILEPNPNDGNVNDAQLTLACLESSLAMQKVFNGYKSVILTSGTMSPMEMYPKLLNFQPLVSTSIDIQLSRNSINPLIVNKGSDQIMISSEFTERNNKAVIRNYANLLISMCQSVPDGIVCFFPSYRYMEDVISQWNEMAVLEKILDYKVLYIESVDANETSISLHHFRKACDIGRGGVFLSVARGKVAEGIDFNNHYGRCVIIFGLPFQYTKCRILNQRLEYLKTNKSINKEDFLVFDAMRQCAQCLGRVIRNKQDYGLMVLADKRYERKDKIDKLPKWIKDQIENKQAMTVDMAHFISRDYFRKMAQTYQMDTQFYYQQTDFKII